MLDKLQQALELKEEGKDLEVTAIMKDLGNEIDQIINEEEERKRNSDISQFDRSVFPTYGELFCEGDKSLLRVMHPAEKEKYISLSYEYSPSKSSFKNKTFIDDLWNDFIGEHVFTCTIIDRKTSKYVGYCSIKDLRKEEWEIAIELLPECCHKGYGTEAIPLFVKKIAELTQWRYFRVRVDIDNYASQALMNKIGAYANGVSEFLLRGKDLEQFKRENLHLIDDNIRKVAEEFCMTPEDILGMVLEYRIDVEQMNDNW